MPHSVLIVDDDPNILDTARDILEDAGFTVFSGMSGESALKILSTTPIDVALFDLNLLDTLGTDLAIQAKKLNPKLIILLLTGEGDIDLGAARDAVSAVLTKPVSPMQLIQVIREKVDS